MLGVEQKKVKLIMQTDSLPLIELLHLVKPEVRQQPEVKPEMDNNQKSDTRDASLSTETNPTGNNNNKCSTTQNTNT